MATPVDLELRPLPDAVRLSPGIGLSFRGSGQAPAANGESLPSTERPDDVRAHCRSAVRPVWAWPGAMAGAVPLHAAVLLLLVVLWLPSPQPPELIEVTVVADADAAPGQSAGAAASTDESKPRDANPAPDAAPSPAAAEPRPSPARAERTADEETPPLLPVPAPAGDLPPPAEPTAAASPPERSAADDQAAQASAPEAPRAAPELSQPPAPTVAASAPEPSATEPVPPLPTSETAPAREPRPAPAATQVPQQTHEITGRAHAKPPARPVVAALTKPADKPPKSEAADRKPASPAAQTHDNASARDSARAFVRQAANQGAAEASPGASQMARASHGAVLSAEIARHKVYPEAARAAGATGSVGVVLDRRRDGQDRQPRDH